MDIQWPDAPPGAFPDSAGILLTEAILPQDISLSYRSFRDCGPAILNEYAPIVLAQSQNDIGLEWILTEDWEGAVVSVYAHSLLYPSATFAQEVHGYIRDADSTHRALRMDFAAGVPWPVDYIVFRAKVALTIPGETLTHVTRGILVEFIPDPV